MNSIKLYAAGVVTVCVMGYVANVRASAIALNIWTEGLATPVLYTEDSNVALPINSLAMLFWTSSQNFEGFNTVNPSEPLGGNILLDTLSTTGGVGHKVPGHITAEGFGDTRYESVDHDVNLPSGYVYVAAFNLAYTTYQTSGVPVGTWYALTPLIPFDASSKGVMDTPDLLGKAITDQGTYTMTVQTIPEPGTMVLFAIGSVAFLGLRHRFKRS